MLLILITRIDFLLAVEIALEVSADEIGVGLQKTIDQGAEQNCVAVREVTSSDQVDSESVQII